MQMSYPLLVEFVRGTWLVREDKVTPKLPILQNGPPGTFVVFSNGDRVPLPSDQIIFSDDEGGVARVAFGGMKMGDIEKGQLVFHRVRDLWPADKLSPERARRMTLEPAMVASIAVDGRVVWRAS